jgi:hypothetical protein
MHLNRSNTFNIQVHSTSNTYISITLTYMSYTLLCFPISRTSWLRDYIHTHTRPEVSRIRDIQKKKLAPARVHTYTHTHIAHQKYSPPLPFPSPKDYRCSLSERQPRKGRRRRKKAGIEKYIHHHHHSRYVIPPSADSVPHSGVSHNRAPRPHTSGSASRRVRLAFRLPTVPFPRLTLNPTRSAKAPLPSDTFIAAALVKLSRLKKCCSVVCALAAASSGLAPLVVPCCRM